MIGRTLAHYEVTQRIGAGGMGEVYRARDTKLGREVALKVLPELFARDAERLARFQREAKFLASLNHPNIAHLYGLEEDGGTHFLVMELVEGEDLSERVRGKGIPVAEALRISRAVADALAAAHDQGVVHRDLKPANIKVTPDGDIRVLDFGLAKALEGDPGDPNISQSPTLTAIPGTSHGVILGTAAYMSPEQARGKAVDRRSDVWSFGCVLFEMLTGAQVFPGETVSDTIARILEREPQWDLLPAETPPGVQRLLRRCLEKDQKKRLGDIGDARFELDDTMSGASGVWPDVKVERVEGGAPGRARGWMITAMVAVAAAAALAVMQFAVPRQEAPVQRTLIDRPLGSRFISMGDHAGPAVISPDGRRVAFVASGEDLDRFVWVRELDQLEPRMLAGTKGASFPFWSPDGLSVAFFADGKLRRVALSGGLPISVCEASNGRGGSWGPDGTMIIAPGFRTGLLRVPDSGGELVALTTIDTTLHSTHRWPEFMPDGRHFIYMAAHHDVTRNYESAIYFGSLDEEATHRVIETSTSAVYASGHILYMRDNTLLAAPFDPSSGEFTGDPQPLVDKVQYDLTTWRSAISASQTGMLVYHPVSDAFLAGTKIAAFDREGNETAVIDQTWAYYHLSLSHDQRYLAASVAGDGSGASDLDVWVYDLERSLKTRLTFRQGADISPVWSPDGKQLAYATIHPGAANRMNSVNIIGADGSDDRTVWESQEEKWVTDWSMDGKYLLVSVGDYVSGNAADNDNIWAMPLEEGAEPFLVLDARYDLDNGAISPDSRWMAYASLESGITEVYVTAFKPPADAGGDPNDHRPAGKWQISSDGGDYARWSADGKHIYYIWTDGRVWVADVDGSGETFRVGEVRLLFRSDPWNFGRIAYDVSSDGEMFVINSFSESGTPPVVIVDNWLADLRR